jgi:hypothetical protein
MEYNDHYASRYSYEGRLWTTESEPGKIPQNQFKIKLLQIKFRDVRFIAKTVHVPPDIWSAGYVFNSVNYLGFHNT